MENGGVLLKFRFKIWNLRFWDAFAGCKSLFTDWIRFINCNFTLQFAKLILHLHIEFENRNRLMEEYNVAIRLKGFIESQGLTNSQFADRCGIPRPSLSQLLTGRNKKISDVLVGQIHHAFPKLSVLWLMFGEGNMLVTDQSEAAAPAGDGEMSIDFQNFPTDSSEYEKYRAQNGLNAPKEGLSARINTGVPDDLRIAELERQIEKMRKNPRKVSHITVYYDDSTFETFYPRR